MNYALFKRMLLQNKLQVKKKIRDAALKNASNAPQDASTEKPLPTPAEASQTPYKAPDATTTPVIEPETTAESVSEIVTETEVVEEDSPTPDEWEVEGEVQVGEPEVVEEPAEEPIVEEPIVEEPVVDESEPSEDVLVESDVDLTTLKKHELWSLIKERDLQGDLQYSSTTVEEMIEVLTNA